MDHQRYVKRLFSSIRLGTFVSVAFFIGFVVVSVAFAADDALPTSGISGLPFASKSPTGSITALIKQVVLYTGILAVVSLTWGGFLFITAFGEDEKIKKGKNIVKFSLIGVLLSISAYAIVDVVNRLAV
jgi:hypothetical protein